MIKRILVALDYDADTPVATQYATEIARRQGAEVTGLALVDRRAIEADAGGAGIGAMAYAEKLQDQLSHEAHAQAKLLLDGFHAELDAAGVRHPSSRVDEGSPVERIVDDMKAHDLLIAGHESRFFYPDRDRRTHALDAVVGDSPAATLVVEDRYQPIRRVVVAYDGSVGAARAMQQFAQLAPFDPAAVEVEVAHVRGTGEDARAESELQLGRAQTYLAAHGFAQVAAQSLSGSSPKDRLLEYCRQHHGDLLVAGAHSQSRVKEFFFGSTTKGLIENARIPLFLYH